MRLRYTLLLFCLCCASGVVAQNGSSVTAPVPDSILSFAAVMPEPAYDYNEYLSKNIHYPDSAKEKNITGKVIVRFVVNEDGHISDCKVMRGAGGGLDEEALRVIKSFPAWKPGRQNDKAVKVYFIIPVTFSIADEGSNRKETVPWHPIHIDTSGQPKAPYDVVQYIGNNIQYPRNARRKGIQGKVMVKFAVNEDSTISDVSINEGVNEELDLEALRVIKTLPKWAPGKHNGIPVKSYVIFPIGFYLKEDKKDPRIGRPDRPLPTHQKTMVPRK